MIILFAFIISAILIGTSYLITEKNAKYYLSAYWNLTPEKREQIDLKGFLANWKRVMWISGGVITITGIILFFSNIDPGYSILTILALMIISLIVYYLTGRKYNSNRNQGLKQ